MARAVLTLIVIDSSPLFRGRGDVRRWHVSLMAEVKTEARALAPPSRSRARWGRGSTGRLRRSISAKSARLGSANILDGTLSVNVPYAKYVIGGTAAQGRRFIYSTEGWFNKAEVDLIASRFRQASHGKGQVIERGWAMKVPAGAGFRGGPLLRVHGQRANNFLVDGYNLAAHRHRSLKPITTRFIFKT